MNFFNKNTEDKKKNIKLTGSSIRLRIFRLINNTPVETSIMEANLKRDKYNNTIIFNGENNIKEELPGLHDSLISDILYKLESRGLSTKEQLIKVKDSIEKQEKIISSEKKGYITKKEGNKDVLIKINIKTEKTKLRLLKCIKYTLENKKGEGFFESVELDGTRSLTYLIRDGELIPYWHKTPESNGEPVMLVPDIVQRKKFYKEATDETINDYNESQDTKWRGILGVITKALYIMLALALIWGNVYTVRMAGELNDESLQHDIDSLKVENENIKQLCSSQLANQIENNGVLIDYAKNKLKNEQKQPEPENKDKSNIKI